MKLDMVSPCTHCPFRSDIPGFLRGSRVLQITTDVLNGGSFPCHKTTEPVVSDDGMDDNAIVESSQECAGSRIFAAKNGTSSQWSRIARRLGCHVADVDMTAPVYSSVKEMLIGHNL